MASDGLRSGPAVASVGSAGGGGQSPLAKHALAQSVLQAPRDELAGYPPQAASPPQALQQHCGSTSTGVGCCGCGCGCGCCRGGEDEDEGEDEAASTC